VSLPDPEGLERGGTYWEYARPPPVITLL
jgi:hypothetical protein